MERVEGEPAAVDQRDMGDSERQLSRFLFHHLVLLLRGAPSLVFRQVAAQHGLEAWRRRCFRYEGSSRSKKTALLAAGIRPFSAVARGRRRVRGGPDGVGVLGGSLRNSGGIPSPR